MPETAMIAGPDGKSSGTDTEKPTIAATTALTRATANTPAMLRPQQLHGWEHEKFNTT